MNVVLTTIIVGIGATLAIDIWVIFLKLFNIESLDYKYSGRWVGSIPKGKFLHNKIFNTPQIRYEAEIGWFAHYLIGITFACLLVVVYGKNWLDNPTLLPAIIIGIITVAAPFLILQPVLGFGFASSKLPKPNIRRLKSLMTHTIYGFGLYLTALLLKQL
ncbi:MAG: DUF2938 domain-containing protein [Ignavibacteriae bacterium]|nr:DUF2938 domain-containing protein [Ignavibacteriota bacterium]